MARVSHNAGSETLFEESKQRYGGHGLAMLLRGMNRTNVTSQSETTFMAPESEGDLDVRQTGNLLVVRSR